MSSGSFALETLSLYFPRNKYSGVSNVGGGCFSNGIGQQLSILQQVLAFFFFLLRRRVFQSLIVPSLPSSFSNVTKAQTDLR